MFPTEEWVPPEREVSIDAEKIKQMSMNMNLPVPEWMRSEEMLKGRIMELFGGANLPTQKH